MITLRKAAIFRIEKISQQKNICHNFLNYKIKLPESRIIIYSSKYQYDRDSFQI